jgi:hypothetical protein
VMDLLATRTGFTAIRRVKFDDASRESIFRCVRQTSKVIENEEEGEKQCRRKIVVVVVEKDSFFSISAKRRKMVSTAYDESGMGMQSSHPGLIVRLIRLNKRHSYCCRID